MVGNTGTIYVDADFGNIFSIDPNKVYDENGNAKQRLVNHEELVMYANLECVVPMRTKLLLGVGNEQSQNITIASTKINFLNPGGKFFYDNSYTDDFTGKNVLNGDNKAKSQPDNNRQTTRSENYETTQSSISEGAQQTSDTGLLGITAISYKMNASFLPSVMMTLEDVRGRALFELGDQSPYSAFFNLPYPLFYLTIKGYYGKAVKLPLMLQRFNASFNSASGNFVVTLEFYAYKYSILTEIFSNYLIALPNMYETINNVSTGTNQGTGTQTSVQIKSTRGYELIKNMYSQYESKGLIPVGFPRYTIREFVNKLETFVVDLQSNMDLSEVNRIANAEDFKEILTGWLNKELITVPDSWYNTYANFNSPIVLKPTEVVATPNTNQVPPQKVIYPAKNKTTNNTQTQSDLQTDCETILKKYLPRLRNNPNYGECSEDITVNDFLIKTEDIDKNNIDYEQTFIKRNGRTPSQTELETLKTQISESLVNRTKELTGNGQTEPNPIYYIDLETYQKKYQNIVNKFNTKTEQDDLVLSQKISDQLSNAITGIGFKPTIRNVMAVLFASMEAFLRLLDEVHQQAWGVRTNDQRRQLTFKDGSTDNIKNFPTDNVVFPWPQIVTVNSQNGQETFTLEYPGEILKNDPNFQGVYKEIWPEVEFVEQLLLAITTRSNMLNDKSIIAGDQAKPLTTVSENVLDFPISSRIYLNKDEVKFFYELWERIFSNSFYTRLSRNSTSENVANTIAEFEAQNLIVNLSGFSIKILSMIKNGNFNSDNIVGILRHFSNSGLGQSWQLFIREQFNTEYINNELQTSTQIFSTGVIPIQNIVYSAKSEQNLINYINSTTHNQPDFLDTYPFNDQQWIVDNLANGVSLNVDLANNTKETMSFNKNLKLVTNFETTSDESNLPFVNFNSLQNIDIQFDLNTFYLTREFKDYMPTEGYLQYSFPTTNLQKSGKRFQKTTSVLNTPIFINSMITALQKFRANNRYPFVTPAYLFLNSLPLITLREKFKKDAYTEKDYAFSCIKKFGGLHKLPYAWILKYGSIWYRYKNFIETGNDILQNDWSDFQYTQNFDPVTNSPTRTYNLNINQSFVSVQNYEIFLENDIFSSGVKNSNINLGFYPSLIDDFNVIYQGLPLFSSYTDTDIQTQISSNQLFIFPYDGGNNNRENVINRGVGFDPSYTARTLTINTWNCLTKAYSATSEGEQYFILPSFGTKYNETIDELFSPLTFYTTMTDEVMGNQNMYNGSARLLWGSPNFGYFDLSGLTKPTPIEYTKEIISYDKDQPNYGFQTTGYTDISEMLAVFDITTLDIFEAEFLKFSKSVYDFDNSELTDGYGTQKNFQALFRNLMKINKPQGNNSQEVLQNIIEQQTDNFDSVIYNFLHYEIILKIGNPSNFDRRLFYSFSNTSSTKSPVIQDEYEYFPYLGNLPPDITFAASLSNNPTAWEALRTYVGFLNYSSFTYSSNGSVITDFFRDLNVEFTANNVKNLRQLIKIYATQKFKDNTYDAEKFRTDLTDKLNEVGDFRNIVIDQIFSNADLKKAIPDIQANQTNNLITQDQVTSKQTKIEIWEALKAFNDKWIAGNNFDEKTIFEDILFLDRASRDVGNLILLDIFELKNFLKDVFKIDNTKEIGEIYDEKGIKNNFLGIIRSIIEKNHFVFYPLPSYVNFYGIQTPVKNPNPKVDDPLDFANTLFGTFADVDTRDSSPKMVCFYANKPSEQLAINKPTYKFNNDTWNFVSPVNNPVYHETQSLNYALSNKVVGFNVDMGVQNQNVFYNISLNQTPGKATAESLAATQQLANYGGMQGAYSPSASLYNIYKSRSYQCEIALLGNVMIQPMMYFNLSHVPMFNGPYLITDVQHDIRPGTFETRITGTRQPISALPNVTEKDSLMVIKNMYLSQIKSQIIANSKNKDVLTAAEVATATQEQKDTIIIENYLGKITPSTNQSCSSGLIGDALEFQNDTVIVTTVSTKLVKDILAGFTDVNDNVKKTIFALVWIRGFKNNNFQAYNNNYGGVPLNIPWGEILNSITTKKYICLNVNENQIPFVSFGGVDECLIFIKERLKFLQLKYTDNMTVENITDEILTSYPKFEKENTIKTNSPTQYDQIKKLVEQSVLNYNSLL